MPRRFLRKFMPRPHHHRATRWGKLIHNPNLWHLNRHSVARGISLGVFWAFTPLPFGQLLFATLLAIRLRANVALAAAFTWVCNPLTLAPTYYLAYSLGRMLLRRPPMPDFEPSRSWLTANLPNVWLPYTLGSMLLASTCGGFSYIFSQEYWKWRINRRWNARARMARDEIAV